jgi:hypothetical protein
MRSKADEMAGSAVLTLMEKRIFLARRVRCNLAEFDPKADGDLVQAVKDTEHGREYRLPDKIAAIKLDHDLSHEESEAQGKRLAGRAAGAVHEVGGGLRALYLAFCCRRIRAREATNCVLEFGLSCNAASSFSANARRTAHDRAQGRRTNIAPRRKEPEASLHFAAIWRAKI